MATGNWQCTRQFAASARAPPRPRSNRRVQSASQPPSSRENCMVMRMTTNSQLMTCASSSLLKTSLQRKG
eukprot:14461623-Alexandrium_andersonii.AAC.1